MYSTPSKLAVVLFIGIILLIFYINWDSSRAETESEELNLLETDSFYEAQFQVFQDKFSKSYSDDKEKEKRFKVFKDKALKVKKMNAEAKSAGKKVTYGVNTWSDWTHEEMKEKILTYGQVTYPEGHTTGREMLLAGQVSKFKPLEDCPACTRYPGHSKYTFSNMPTDFDWRDYGAVTDVKNQAECGSCWTFSSTGDVEGAWFLAGNDLISLSEQELVACDTHINAGCNGGLQELAFMFIERVGGLVSEDDYEYKKKNMYTDTITTPNCDSDIVAPGNFAAHIAYWQYVALGAEDETILQLSLLKAGPLAIAMNADGMEYYSSGIDDPDDCSSDDLDHAVLLVGYGVEDGVDYWTIKNSWADTWGEDGYYRIVRGSNACGVSEDALHTLINKPTDDD